MISDTHVNKMLIIVAYLVIAAVVSAQQDFCREGTYGHDCELTCSSNCRPLQSFPCDKATGKCSEGCKKGYYGSTCNLPCTCDSGVCIQESGGCIDDSTKINTSDKPVTDVSPNKCETSCDGVSVAWLVLAILFLIVILFGIAFLVYMRCRGKQQKTDKSGQQGRLELWFPCLKCQRDTSASSKGKKTPESKTIELEVTSGAPSVSQCLLGENQGADENAQPPEMEKKENATSRDDLLQQRNELVRDLEKKLQDAEEKLKEVEVDENKAIEMQSMILRNLGLPLNSVYHNRKVIDSHQVLQCPQFNYDKTLVNVTHLDSQGVMWNKAENRTTDVGPDTPNKSPVGFQNYHGTSSTRSITKTDFDQYWEVSLEFKLNKPLGENEVLLDLGFCIMEERDASQFTPTRENCYSLKLVSGKSDIKTCLYEGSKEHKDSISFPNQKDFKTTINIGILVNNKLDKIRFFELTKPSLIKHIQVKSTKELWPMFGLGAQLSATASLKLVTGFDIEMTPAKKKMIDEAK